MFHYDHNDEITAKVCQNSNGGGDMSKRLLILTFLAIICCNISIYADTKPVLVIASIRVHHNRELKWNIYPEYAVDENGMWREATVEDFWIGQKFDAYTVSCQTLKFLNKVEIESIGEDQGFLKKETDPYKYINDYWGIYLGQKNLRFKGNGKRVIGKAIDKTVTKDLLQKKVY